MSNRLLNILLILGIVSVFPFYQSTHNTHQLVQKAQSSGIWNKIPKNIPTLDDYQQAITTQALSLSLKIKFQGTVLNIEAEDYWPIYQLLHFINSLPTISIQSFKIQRNKTKAISTIELDIPKQAQPTSSNLLFPAANSFYSPQFFYVNAIAEVDGQKQIWVNEQNYGPSCPWPLYHTFDKKTGSIKKGDLRPRLSLTSKE